MGWSFRKSKKIGPFRFSIGKRGPSVSVGTKGLRVGAGPRGTRITAGAGGVRYEARVGGHPHGAPVQHQQTAPPAPRAGYGGGLIALAVIGWLFMGTCAIALTSKRHPRRQATQPAAAIAVDAGQSVDAGQDAGERRHRRRRAR